MILYILWTINHSLVQFENSTHIWGHFVLHDQTNLIDQVYRWSHIEFQQTIMLWTEHARNIHVVHAHTAHDCKHNRIIS